MGLLKLFSGIARIFKRREPELKVAKIRFIDTTDIYYAVYPTGKEPYIVLPAGLFPPKSPPLVKPPKSFPAANTTHWEKMDVLDDPLYSWPLAFIRRGGNQYAQWSAEIMVKFNGLYKGDITIKADCQTIADDGRIIAETLKVPETKVTFNNEDQKTFNITFDAIPDVVRHMGKLEIKWEYKTASMAGYKPANTSKHCLFAINAKPLVPKKLQAYDYFLFEIIDWSCKWADGKSTVDEIEKAIWLLFHPFDPVQDNTNKLFKSTGLYYWTTAHLLSTGKNITKAIDLNQSLPEAIQGKWDANLGKKCSASCIVFDRIFMGSLGIQGIPTQEIVVRVTGDQLGKTFGHKGKYYKSADCFVANSRYAQGNKNAPEAWGNHWIAFVYKGQGNSVPLAAPGLYDPSYGGTKIANINQAQDALIEYEKGVKGYLTTTVPGKKDYIIPRAEMGRKDFCLETIVNVELT